MSTLHPELGFTEFHPEVPEPGIRLLVDGTGEIVAEARSSCEWAIYLNRTTDTHERVYIEGTLMDSYKERFLDEAIQRATNGSLSLTSAEIAAGRTITEKIDAIVDAQLKMQESSERHTSISQHSLRVGDLAAETAKQDGWCKLSVSLLRKAGYVHDGGKAENSVLPILSIIHKPGVLTPEEKVGKLLTLPTDEQPTVATVQDKEKLKDQPFFKDAQNGDKLLIYTKAQKAIIYREEGNKLINVGPVTLDTQAPAANPAAKPAQ